MIIQGLIVICLGLPLFYLGYMFYKKSHNEKLCRGAFAIMFRSPDRAWFRLLPCKNGIIQKPEGKYLLKKERNIRIPWPEAGYVVPKDTAIPPIKWPINASPFVQATVGMLVYDVGNPMPRPQAGLEPLGQDHESPIDPNTILSIYNANTAEKVFTEYDKMLDLGLKKGGKFGDLLPLIAIGLCAITLVLVFLMYTNMNSMAGDISTIKAGMGY